MSDEEIEFNVGDVFTTPEGPIKVVSNGYDMMVTDPTVNHPQDPRTGRWRVDRKLLREDIQDPESDVERGSLEVTA